MIQFDSEKCTHCGLCVRICHEHCLDLNGEELLIVQAACSHCTQCIAVCPPRALSWDGILPQPNQDEFFPEAAQVRELLQQRRTIRHFKKRIPDRTLIEKVVQMGIYAPRHNQDFRTVLVDDPVVLEALDQATYQNVKLIYYAFFKQPWISFLAGIFSPAILGEMEKARPKLERSLQIGRGYAALPPVLVFLVSKKRIPLSLESAQYTLFAIDLYARTKGLGVRNLVGNQDFFSRSRKVRSLLDLQKDERIYAVAGMGYPSIKFSNKVQGRTIPLEWIN